MIMACVLFYFETHFTVLQSLIFNLVKNDRERDKSNTISKYPAG